MPKMKTKRGAAKRFKLTATGKVKRHKANTSHILTTKKRKRKRNLRHATTVKGGNAKRIRQVLQG